MWLTKRADGGWVGSLMVSCGGGGGVKRHRVSSDGGCHGSQPNQSHEVVCGGDQIAREVDALQAAEPRPAQTTHRFDPAEDFFDPSAHLLTGVVARPAGRPSVHGATAATDVLSNVRRDALRSQAPHKLPCVIGLVGAERSGMEATLTGRIDQLRYYVPLSGTVAVVTWKSTNRPCRFSISA